MQEINAQTIYGMTLPEFTDYLVGIMERVFNPRFEAIEARLDNIEKDIVFIKKDIEEIKDTLHMSQYRFGLLERDAIRHDRLLEELAS